MRADLVHGSVFPVELLLPGATDHAGSAAGSKPVVQRLPRRPGPVVNGGALVDLAEPVAVRLDGEDVLAWDTQQHGHVLLEREHLELLRQFAEPTTVDDLAGPDHTARIGELVALGIVRVLDPGEPSIASPEAVDVGSGPTADDPVSESADPEVGDAVPERVVPVAAEGLDGTRTWNRAKRAARHPRATASRLVRIARAVVQEWTAAGAAVGQTGGARDPDRSHERDPESDQGPPPGPAREPVPVSLVPDQPIPDAQADIDDVGSEIGGPAASDDRVPVVPLYCWAEIHSDRPGDFVEPCLSIGALFATARHVDGGRLNEEYDLRHIRPDPIEVFDEWAADPRPTVFVFSDYLWNVGLHLDLSRRVKELSPESVCVHGGPSCPKYEDDTARFLDEHPYVDVAARGEGEELFVDLLSALDGDLGADGFDRLARVDGITYRRRLRPDEIIRTADRDRPTDLDRFPSPYLTGEFDLLLEAPWRSASVETNRGCPYGCTFCDWGSATMSRIRSYDLDRVLDELTWIMEHASPDTLLVNDANFGIMARDVEITRHIVGLKQSHPELKIVIFAGLAKNTTKHTKEIFDLLVGAGIATMAASLAIQTTDTETLRINRRHNIRLDKYEQLARTFEEHGLPAMTDILMGLPGSTPTTFRADLQHCFDRDVSARVFQIHLLPNSPMNEPEYRSEHAVRANEHGIVVSTSSYSLADYEEMKQIRVLFRGADHFGVLRHLLRFVQWDYGVPALDVLDGMNRVIADRSDAYPLISFFGRVFDLYTMPPVGWPPFFDEVRQLLSDHFDVPDDSALQAMIDLQCGVLPAIGRSFPDEVRIGHDYPAYVRAHAEAERIGVEHPRLDSFPPSRFTVSDPADVCGSRIRRNDFPVQREMESGNLFWVGSDWELRSPVARRLFSNMAIFQTEEAA